MIIRKLPSQLELNSYLETPGLPFTKANNSCQTAYLGKASQSVAEVVWAVKGNASGRYKQIQVRGLERTGLLILQRGLVLVVTATPSPLQKPQCPGDSES